jgi:hypothetical protein
MHRIAWIGLKARGSKGASFTWRLKHLGEAALVKQSLY